LEHKPTEYPISLSTTHLAVQVFDGIRQIYGKPWADQSELCNLLVAFHGVFSSRPIFKKAFETEIMPHREHWRTFCNGVRTLIRNPKYQPIGWCNDWTNELEKLYKDFDHINITDVP